MASKSFLKLDHIPYLGVLFLTIAAYGPSQIFIYDMWDGVLATAAFEKDSPELVKNWIYEAAVHFNYFIYLLIYSITEITGISLNIIYFAFSISIISVIGFEIFTLCKDALQIDRTTSFILSLIAVVSPSFTVITSSIMIFHFFCIASMLIGARLLARKTSLASLFIGILMLCISFGFKSNHLFSVAILALNLQILDRFSLKTFKTLIQFSLFSVIYFLGYKTAFPTYGLYETYNRILNPLDPEALNRIIFSFLGYVEYLKPSFIILACQIVLQLIIFRPNLHKKEIFTSFFVLLFALLSAVLPYVLVGKVPYSFDYTGWSMRLGLLTSLWFVLASAVIHKTLSFNHLSEGRALKLWWLNRSFLLTILVYFSFCLNVGNMYKFQTYSYHQDLQRLLSQLSLPVSGLLLVEDPNYPYGEATIYESNRVFENSFKHNGYFGVITSYTNKEVKIPKVLERDITYVRRYMFADYIKSDCEIFVSVISEGYRAYHRDWLSNFPIPLWNMGKWKLTLNSVEYSNC